MRGTVTDAIYAPDRAEDADDRDRLEHDIRQSLCAMTLMLDTISEEPLGSTGVLRRLEQIRRETEWMSKVLNDTGDTAAEPVDLGEVVAATWRLVAHEAACAVRLFREPVAAVRAEPVALMRAVRNLVDNAVRAAGPDGSVELRVQSRGPVVVIEVADSGPGFGLIPRQHGHGLVTARKELARFGGRLVIGTDRLLGGALMHVELPALLDDIDGCDDFDVLGRAQGGHRPLGRLGTLPRIAG